MVKESVAKLLRGGLIGICCGCHWISVRARGDVGINNLGYYSLHRSTGCF